MLKIIVATNRKGALGLEGKMPWHHRNDLIHFKNVTLNQKVVMGRRTLQHMQQVLDNREVFCVTTQEAIQLPSGQQVTLIHDFEEFCRKYQSSDSIYYIAGGESIYRLALPYVHEMIISFVYYSGEADTFFPNFYDEDFRIIKREKKLDFEVVTYRRLP